MWLRLSLRLTDRPGADMEQAFQFCETRVREADKDRFLATLFAPERLRAPLFALYAFDLEIAQVRDRISSPLPGEVRLQWWRDVLTGSGPGNAASPIAAGLLDAVRRVALPVTALTDLIDAHTFDLYDEPTATVADLEKHATATAGAVIRLAAWILNDGHESGLVKQASHAAVANTITDVMLRLSWHSVRGQRYVPDDVLARHGASATDVLAGRATLEVKAALVELRDVARQHLAALRSEGAGVPARLLPAFLPVSLVPSRLERLERRDADPFRPQIVPQWRRQWTLWRAARRPARFIRTAPDDEE